MRTATRERTRQLSSTSRATANTFLGFRLVVWMMVGGWALLMVLFNVTDKTGNAIQQAGYASNMLVNLAIPTVVGLAADRFFAILQELCTPRPASEEDD